MKKDDIINDRLAPPQPKTTRRKCTLGEAIDHLLASKDETNAVVRDDICRYHTATALMSDCRIDSTYEIEE